MKQAAFIDTNEYTEQQMTDMMNLALTLKACERAGYYPPLLQNRSVALLMEDDDPYLCTACDQAARQLGALPQRIRLPLSVESARDTAALLSRLFDCAVIRCQRHEALLSIAKYADVPLINAGSSYCLPVQELADLITMYEHLPKEKRLDACKIVFDGPASALCASTLFLATKMGMQFCQLADAPAQLPPPFLKIGERNVKRSGGTYAVTESSAEAYRDADFLRTELAPGELARGDGTPFHIDTLENRAAAAKVALLLMLYRDPAQRDVMLIEKLKRTLAVKLHAVFGYGLRE